METQNLMYCPECLEPSENCLWHPEPCYENYKNRGRTCKYCGKKVTLCFDCHKKDGSIKKKTNMMTKNEPTPKEIRDFVGKYYNPPLETCEHLNTKPIYSHYSSARTEQCLNCNKILKIPHRKEYIVNNGDYVRPVWGKAYKAESSFKRPTIQLSEDGTSKVTYTPEERQAVDELLTHLEKPAEPQKTKKKKSIEAETMEEYEKCLDQTTKEITPKEKQTMSEYEDIGKFIVWLILSLLVGGIVYLILFIVPTIGTLSIAGFQWLLAESQISWNIRKADMIAGWLLLSIGIGVVYIAAKEESKYN